jgi:hypothetical protein
MSDNLSSSQQAKLVGRIQALMSKTEANGCTEAEAQAAAEKVQELLRQHNLDMTVLEASGQQAREKREQTKFVGSAAYDHQRYLMSVIAETNFCMVWVKNDQRFVRGAWHKTKSYVILGRQANVVTTIEMFKYLNGAMENLVPVPNTQRNSRWALSWKAGCSQRLRDRLRQRAAEAKAASEEKARREAEQKAAATGNGAPAEPGTALTLSSVYDSEYAQNYDAAFGEGAYARMLARQAEHAKTREQREAEYAAAEEKRKAEREDMLAKMTPAQRKAFLAREAAREQRERERQERRWKRQDERVDWDAYQEGREAADDIGLDDQIEHEAPAPVAGHLK